MLTKIEGREDDTVAANPQSAFPPGASIYLSSVLGIYRVRSDEINKEAG